VFFTHVNEHILVLAVHVDNCIFTGSFKELIALYKQKLNDCYTLTDLGPIHWLPGIKVTHNQAAHMISLSQTSFIDTILSHFSLNDVKPYGCSMAPGAIYSKKDLPSSAEEIACMKCIPYHQAISSLMYATVATCPDITFTVFILSWFLKNPGNIHWEAVKHTLHYLKGTRDTQLTYGSEQHDLEGFCDINGSMQED
jgi:reverse transcriptase-like protein